MFDQGRVWMSVFLDVAKNSATALYRPLPPRVVPERDTPSSAHMKSMGNSLSSARSVIASDDHCWSFGLPLFHEVSLHSQSVDFFSKAFEFDPFVVVQWPSRFLAVLACLHHPSP